MFVEMSCMKAFLTLLLCLVSNTHDSAMHDTVVSLSNTMPRKVSPNYVVPASSTSSSSANSYAVIFDAGSSATRVHVFCFDHHLNLVPIGNELELFEQGIFYISAQDFCFDHHLNLVPIGKEVDFLSLGEHKVQVLTFKSSCHSFIKFIAAFSNTLPRKISPNYVGASSNSYAVIFDAGSSGSRVHVFCFDHHLNLVPIGNELELFVQLKPGLSAYTNNPKAAAHSLLPLLEKAEDVIPRDKRSSTPVKVGATAGLRQLGADVSERILQAVKDLLKKNSTLKSKADSVTVLDGTQEGSYQWVTINYLFGKIGQNYSSTVGVVDLGGGSVQMAYAISKTDAAKAPRTSKGEEPYVKEMLLKGKSYHLYVHSYLNYGLLAARAEILKIDKDSGNPCILAGYSGSYKYGGGVYQVSASPSGSSMKRCRKLVIKALKIKTVCTHMKCTFGGVWNGGGGAGQKELIVASFFFDRAAEAGFIDANATVAKVRAADFGDAAKRACETKLEAAKSAYPRVDPENLPYLCMDLVYQFALLVDGFDLDPWQEITLVKQVKFQNSFVEAAWPLGSAIETVSALV